MPREPSGVQIKIPRDYSTQESLAERAQALDINTDVTKFFQQGENLAFNLFKADIFGNHIKDDVTLTGISAYLAFGTEGIDLAKTVMPTQIHFYLTGTDNETFKALPPRLNYYKIVVVSSDDVVAGEIPFDIHNLKDANYPDNIATTGDS